MHHSITATFRHSWRFRNHLGIINSLPTHRLQKYPNFVLHFSITKFDSNKLKLNKSDHPEDHDSWDEMFQRLQSFYNSTPSVRTIPLLRANMDPSLKRWIQNQRLSYSQHMRESPKNISELYSKRVDSLKSIGFPFTANEDKWEARFHQLLQYQKQFGHLNVLSPSSTLDSTDPLFKEQQKLKRWVELQRSYKSKKQNQAYTVTPLRDERERRLTEIGFEWTVIHSRDYFDKIPWLRQYQQLTSILKTKENRNTLALIRENKPLMRWIKRQHNERRNLPKEKLKLLNAINFFTNKNISSASKSYVKWDIMFKELQKFHQRHGHCRVPQTFITDGEKIRKLGQWVRTQRLQFKRFQKGYSTPLNTHRINLLNGIGFEWRVYQKRDKSNTLMDLSKSQENERGLSISESNKMISLVKDFHSKHGHIFIPTSYSSNSSSSLTNEDHTSLSLWLLKKRLAYHKQYLTKEGDPDTMKLEALSLTERSLLINSRDLFISEDEITALNDLGFVWSLEDAKWWETYHKLESSQMRGLPRDVQMKLSKHMLLSRSRQTQMPLASVVAVDNAAANESSIESIASDTDVCTESENAPQSISQEKNNHLEDYDGSEETSIDLFMTPAQQKWYKMFERLKKVRSYDSITDPLLQEWIQVQRKRYWKKRNVNGHTRSHEANDDDHLTDEEILALDSISFPWNSVTSAANL